MGKLFRCAPKLPMNFPLTLPHSTSRISQITQIKMSTVSLILGVNQSYWFNLSMHLGKFAHCLPVRL